LLSPAILDEYQKVMRELAVQFPGIKVEALIDFVVVHSEIILPPSLPPVIQADPSDDKFLECAVAGEATCIVTGDKHLLIGPDILLDILPDHVVKLLVSPAHASGDKEDGQSNQDPVFQRDLFHELQNLHFNPPVSFPIMASTGTSR